MDKNQRYRDDSEQALNPTLLRSARYDFTHVCTGRANIAQRLKRFRVANPGF